MSHTPGPWKVAPSGSDTDVPVVKALDPDGFDWLVARVWNGGDSTQRETNFANASLIAAAPDLLKELEHLVRLIDGPLNDGRVSIPGLATLNGAKAAIAKAIT